MKTNRLAQLIRRNSQIMHCVPFNTRTARFASELESAAYGPQKPNVLLKSLRSLWRFAESAEVSFRFYCFCGSLWKLAEACGSGIRSVFYEAHQPRSRLLVCCYVCLFVVSSSRQFFRLFSSSVVLFVCLCFFLLLYERLI